MQTQLQLGRYIHVCIDETHSLANLQDLIPTLAGLCCLKLYQPQQGLNLVDLLECVSFMHT